MVAGALWGGIAGLLKARTGAHEVIVTIMLNYVGFYLVFYALSEQSLLQAPGSANPKSLPMHGVGDRCRSSSATATTCTSASCSPWSPWPWSGGSSAGPPSASGSAPSARTPPRPAPSGIDVGRTYIVVMLISGALVGLAGVNQVLGTVTSGITDRPRRRHRLRRHHRRPARPVATDRHPVGRAAVRRVQGRWLLDAGLRGHPGRHRAGRPVPDRAVHRRPAADPGDLPTAREGGDSEPTTASSTTGAEEIHLPG